ncbi:MAG: hypothetical protein E7253_11770 [Lachnospiraceae bacterium]|nr:hypothetical protein [Lachnospiraceae bacterium]
MPRYIYELAGINVRLCTPMDIIISKESVPYIKKEGKIEEDISFQSTDALPELPFNGTWIEDTYYTILNGKQTMFYRNHFSKPPYAMVIEEDDKICCKYIADKENIFLHTSDILNHIGIEKVLLNHSAFLLHASFIRQEDKAILFTAPCGTGKSTQAELWAKHKGSDILNGDRAAVRYQDGEWRAYGMPFAGTSRIYRNESAPAAAVVVLEQGQKNEIRKLSGRETLGRLLPEISCRRWDADFMGQLMDLLIRLLSEIPVYFLSCLPDEGAVELLYNTLKKDQRL